MILGFRGFLTFGTALGAGVFLVIGNRLGILILEQKFQNENRAFPGFSLSSFSGLSPISLAMTHSLAKYHARSPRYILQPQDNTLIRVAGPRQIPWEEGTDIKNISLSGLAFTAPVELCPIVGEFIKIQFQVPDGNQMACHGLVTRLEPLGKTEMLVGIQFYKLEMAHRIALLQGLAQKLKEQQQKNRASESNHSLPAKLVKNWKAAIAMVFFLSGWLALLIWTWNLKS